jgi:CheY-like chemotaxis protein
MHPSAAWPVVTGSAPSRAADPGVVLLVTGDADLREAASRVLRLHGYQVLTASHAGHAVLKCLQASRVDVALIEMSMDDVSGPALADRLRRQNPNMRAVYFAQPGTVECDGVLVRPFTREDLLAQVTLTLA